MKKALYYWCSVFVLSLGISTYAQAQCGMQVKRTFTCNGVINLIGAVNKSYAPNPWGSYCCGALCDREAKCKSDLEGQWLNNGAFWALLGLSAAEQNTICKAKGGNVRVDYGFDARKKDWQFTKFVAKNGCKCDYTCENGFWKEGNTCVRQACPQNSMINPGVPAWLAIGNSGYKTDDKGGTRFFKPAVEGNCTF